MGGLEAAKLSFGTSAGIAAGWTFGKFAGCMAVIVVIFVILLLLGAFGAVVRLFNANDSSKLTTPTLIKKTTSRAQSRCFGYGAPGVTVQGRISRRVFPGRPNYSSVANGDEPEEVWIVNLANPLCTTTGDADQPSEGDVRAMQMLFDSADSYRAYQSMVGENVRIGGFLEHAITGHHHTPVMIKATRIQPASVVSREPRISQSPPIQNELPSGTQDATPSGPGIDGGVYRAGNGTSSPTVLFKVDPEMTEAARNARYGGSVLLSIVVDTEGRPRDIRVVRSLGMGLDEKAVEAVEKWKFRPGMRDGKPVAVMAQIEINFRLQ
jgi:TonB family protein